MPDPASQFFATGDVRELDTLDPINRGLFARWPFQDPGAAVQRDIGPRRMYLRAAGAVSARPGPVLSPAGRGLSFSSATDYLTTPSAFPASSPMSLVAWLKVSQVSGAFYGQGNSASGSRMSLEVEGTAINFDNADDANGRLKVTWTNYWDRWLRVGWVYDPARSRKAVFVNGVLVASGTSLSAAPPSPGSPLTLGYWAGYGVRGTFQAADLAVWWRGLSDAEFKRLAATPWAGTRGIATQQMFAGWRAPSAVPATADPGAGTLTIAGQGVTATAGAVASPGAGAVAIAGQAVSATAGATVSPGVGQIALAGLATAATAGATASPGAGAVALAGLAAEASAGATASPGAGAIVWQGRQVTADNGAAPNPAPASRTVTAPYRNRTVTAPYRNRTITARE